MKARYLTCVAAALLLAACDSPLDTNPTDSIDAGTALSTARGIELALNGAYRSLQSGSLYSRNQIVHPDLYSDNLDFTGTFQSDRDFSLRNVPSSNGDVTGFWAASYDGINRANNVLAALDNVPGMSDAQKSLARGEALFIRALHYSTLLRWFGDVPIVTDPSAGVGPEALVSRNSAQEVSTLIETDLEQAATLLPAGRVAGRATQSAANALLARTYLEAGKHTQARDRATAVLNNTAYQLMAAYRSIFTTKNNSESIFELQYSLNNQNAIAFWYFPQALGGRLGFAPSANLIAAYEADDDRLDASVATSGTTRYGFKFYRIANGDDNIPLLRLAEMYMIRAEANTRLNADAATIRADIDALRTRAGLNALPTSVNTTAALLDAILQERRVEFAMEGHRFFDLRRFGRAESVLGISANRLLLPIPQSERDVNPNLTQNPGY